MNGLSLKWKYILSTLLILFIIIGVFSFSNLKFQERLLREDDRERVELITEIIKNGLVTIMLEGRGREFQKFLESLIAEDIEEVRIFDPKNGTILASSLPNEIGKKIYPEDREKYSTQRNPEVFIHKKDGKTVYSMLLPILNERPCQRCHGQNDRIRGVLDVEVSMKKTKERFDALRTRTFVFSLLTFLSLAIALAIVTNILVSKPVEALIQTMKRVEGGDFSVRLNTQRSDEIGKLASTFNSMVSELERAREEIQRCHLEEMQRIEKMATLGELAAAVAHEIKNPLAGISGAIQVISEDFPDGDPKKEVISEVLKEIERLDKTVRDLLVFAKPSEPKKINIDIESVVDKAVSLVKARAEKQNVRIKTSYQDNIPQLNIDPQQIQQVLLNVMLNALHEMPGGGTLTITTSYDNHAVTISISDTGHGIPADELRNIFKPFYTTKHTGTGLGLPISRNIIEAHGGEITVESELGVGTTFKIRLPVNG